MNWKRLLLNLGGIAAGGFASIIAQASPTSHIDGHVLAAGIVLPVAANLIGLFQPPPHQE